MVSNRDVMRGAARLIGLSVANRADDDGQTNDDLAGLCRAVTEALDDYNLVCVHTRDAWLLTHGGDVTQKIEFMNRLDSELVAPLIERLRQEEQWRILVISGQPTPTAQHPDLDDRAMLVLAGSQIESNRGVRFDEESAFEGELHPDRASDLMEYFLRE